jgi:hypothetical protein
MGLLPYIKAGKGLVHPLQQHLLELQDAMSAHLFLV